MFQTFTATTTPDTGAARLADLRAQMTAEGVDGFLVPRADAHQGEYVAAADMRLAWLTGFTGSAGFCVALQDVAGVFVDGRYRVQVKNQVDLDAFTPVNWPEVKLADWLKEQLPDGGKVGFDPWLHTRGEIETAEKGLRGSGITLVASDNLVDRIWRDRPALPKDAMTPYPVELSGKTSADKRSELGAILTDAGHSAMVLTQPDAIAWLLNTRGSDLGQTPVALAFAILAADGGVKLFIDPAKVTDDLRAHLGNGVVLHPREDFAAELRALNGKVRLDKSSAPVWVEDRLADGPADVVFASDPVALAKARKNDTEVAGTRAAHIRDGAALASFLAWFDGVDDYTTLTEIDVVTKLEACRKSTGSLVNISFDTICGSGPNGAIMHYRVTDQSNRRLRPDELMVLDSGGQYRDGTTDITRTLVSGTPSGEARRAFTLVLKGMIAIHRIRFPKGVTGGHLDVLARQHLWLDGKDFDHGTGHGVGVFLGVHEGPQRLSRISTVPLEPGMILSNEPGYYREGDFGIRIENLIVVQEGARPEGGDERDWLEFENLTWVPIDRRLIDRTMLSEGERNWLDAYHAKTLARVGPQVSGDVRAWLQTACAPI